MHYPQSKKNLVRSLRRKGWSLNQIYQESNVPITTIRTWITDITLSKEQLEVLKNRTQSALQEGRIRVQIERKNQRNKLQNELFKKGIEEVGNITKRDFFIAGISLYWAEGFKNKHEHRLGFCNSDPNMIKFYILWLNKILGIKKEHMIARLTLNVSYKQKTKELQTYWSNLTEIPIEQFTKTFYQRSKWKKQYNTNEYHGVLRIHVKNSLDLLLKMRGWIEGLKSAKITS